VILTVSQTPTGKDIAVPLDKHEQFLAVIVGMSRQLVALRYGRNDTYTFDGDGWEIHVQGAAGEMVFAKAHGVYWDRPVKRYVGDFRRADFGENVQIRTATRDDGDLIVHPSDSDLDVMVLVSGRFPTLALRGWIRVVAAKRPCYWRTHRRSPAYFVPQANLNPFPLPEE
jgi:hypothetical protein